MYEVHPTVWLQTTWLKDALLLRAGRAVGKLDRPNINALE
jgi:hypothetical protein